MNKDFISNKFEKAVNDIVQSFDPDYHTMLATDFMADVEELTVYFSVVIIEREDKIFMEDIYNRDNNLPVLSNLLWSLLHEVGHLETCDEMIDDEIERINISLLSETQPDLASKKYHKLYNERIATDWAVDFVRNNIDQCLSWDNVLLTELPNFLKTYEVE